MVASPTIRAPVLTSEDVAYLHVHVVEAVDIIIPARHRVGRVKTLEALYIECLASSTRPKSAVKPGDYIVYITTCDCVGSRTTTRYRRTSTMCVDHIAPRTAIDRYDHRARHEDILAIIRD